MSKRGDIEFLSDIKEAIKRIDEYTKEIDCGKFLKDKKTQDAVVRNLQIIGEAAKNITSDFKKKYTDIEWKKLAGLRDKITHYYFGINWDIVWDVAKNKLPALFGKVKDILN
ncbi:MAG: DUF86 domain-containing protein [Candidatus Omnitrophota bacterium]